MILPHFYLLILNRSKNKPQSKIVKEKNIPELEFCNKTNL
jgi:hypothetical protein